MVNRTSIKASQPQSVTFWKSQMMRFNSTSSKPTATKANDSTVPPIGSRERGLSPEEANLAKALTWEQFLTLRKAQRRISIGSSVVGCFIAMGLAWVYVAQKEIDPTETIFGLDAFTVYIGGIMCMGVFGYLLGPPLIGDTVFNLTHRNIIKSYATKQKLFLQHIRKMRVDASRQSMNNPVPDYYGEKIGSLRDYRQWLRDNNEYRRKANEFL
ncbi:DEKNAAC100808 [Brettanomyces naardenensis]|uniref:Presequence translocated-associated motor subunit PAM17 n=1 Tax=Brettanomyces naardenensis TaxID=13370 RepID=A0A448YF53_BRENA|nr:DEKNAAC100808 [Brettanomyces naardenensis]